MTGREESGGAKGEMWWIGALMMPRYVQPLIGGRKSLARNGGSASCNSWERKLLVDVIDVHHKTAAFSTTSHLPPSPSSALQVNTSPASRMLRTAAVRALRAATRAPILRQSTPIRTQIPSLSQSSYRAPTFALSSIRCYSAPSGLSRDEVQGRIMDLLKNFDKVRSLYQTAC